jgi:hypothetical protein
VDEELLIAFVNAIDWTHVDTRFVLHADAGFGDYVGHCSLTLARSLLKVAHEAAQTAPLYGA